MKRIPVVVVSIMLALGSARAEEPVHFADARLQAVVENELWISDPTPTDMLDLVELVCQNVHGPQGAIADLSGLEYATNLRALNLRNHRISDISALAGLTGLQTVALLGNRITSISPLAGLSQLETLDLEQNQISSISALSGLSHLKTLGLHRNFIKDISPLTDLKALTWLDLRVNPMNTDAYTVYLPEIQSNNPGITILYDQPFAGRLVLSAAPGGSVITPGEGEFFFGFYESVLLEAQPDPGFVFASWSGNLASTQNPILLTMDEEYRVQANFASLSNTLHVDDDAPADPGPRDSAASDPQENGTAEHPFDQIQEAVQVARQGASILVHAGTYRENLDLLGKNIHLIGADPNGPAGTPYPVIAGARNGSVVRFCNGERSDCVLTGFVITQCQGTPVGAILCTGSSPTIAHCLIVGNRTSHPDGAAVSCVNSQAVLRNCTIADNYVGQQAAAVTLVDSDAVITNSILWGNAPREILVLGSGNPSIRCCDVQGSWPDVGNLDQDPLFAERGNWVSASDPNVVLGPEDPGAAWGGGDYRLQSQIGRWDPDAQTWVQDNATSPCIDHGDEASPVGREPDPNGAVINMGVYGGTGEASKGSPALPSYE